MAAKKKTRKRIIKAVNLIYAILLISCVVGMIISGAKNNFGNISPPEPKDIIWDYLRRKVCPTIPLPA